jgi:hypothetical protein
VATKKFTPSSLENEKGEGKTRAPQQGINTWFEARKIIMDHKRMGGVDAKFGAITAWAAFLLIPCFPPRLNSISFIYFSPQYSPITLRPLLPISCCLILFSFFFLITQSCPCLD